MSYVQTELIDLLLSVKDENDKINHYLNSYSIKEINEQKKEMENAQIFTKIIDTNANKAIIIEELNKLNVSNLIEVANNLKKLSLKTSTEVDDFMNQIINKIIKETEQNKILVGSLCFELQTLCFIIKDNKYIFKNLLLDRIKRQYVDIMNFKSDNYNEDHGKRIMSVISVLYQSKIISDNVFIEIINDYKNQITFNETMSETNFSIVEKAMNQLCHFLTLLKFTPELLIITDNIDTYLEQQLKIYNDKKCISKKVRFICENTIEHIKK